MKQRYVMLLRWVGILGYFGAACAMIWDKVGTDGETFSNVVCSWVRDMRESIDLYIYLQVVLLSMSLRRDVG